MNAKDYVSKDFVVSMKDSDEDAFFRIPLSSAAGSLLTESLANTLAALTKVQPLVALPQYSPAEKHATKEPMRVPLDTDYMAKARKLYNLAEVETNAQVLEAHPAAVYLYFVRFEPNEAGPMVLGVKQAAQFKGGLKSRWLSLGDELDVVKEKLFRLDSDFDFLITNDAVFMLRVDKCEYLLGLEVEMRLRAPAQVTALRSHLPFLDLSCFSEALIGKASARDIRLLASVAARPDLAQTDKQLLKRYCLENNIPLKLHRGKLIPTGTNPLGILKALDRRLYQVMLIKDKHERYEASSRHAKNGTE
jgi:hypothetical protein